MVSQNITLKWSWSCRGKARRPGSVATGHPTDAKGHLLNPSTRLWRQRCMYTNRRSVLKVASKPHSCNTQNTRQPYLIWPVVNNMFIDFFLHEYSLTNQPRNLFAFVYPPVVICVNISPITKQKATITLAENKTVKTSPTWLAGERR